MSKKMDKNLPVEDTLKRLVDIYGADGTRGLWPTAEQWRFCLTCGHKGPVVTIGFYKIRDKALYEDRESDITGHEALMLYTAHTTYAENGATALYHGPYNGTVIGEEDVRWNMIAVSRYPSIEDFVQIMLDEKYKEAIPHRVAAQDNHRLIISFAE